ncbi:hypothetical protein IW262DRAFT_1406636 [Armillaria fumosa]|nr:hypothetical protein IW262DRAFT_1406636 [Armillaria fumosa]
MNLAFYSLKDLSADVPLLVFLITLTTATFGQEHLRWGQLLDGRACIKSFYCLQLTSIYSYQPGGNCVHSGLTVKEGWRDPPRFLIIIT